jgi:4-hydroxy-3-polyprenylbenzoate decarboxylase
VLFDDIPGFPRGTRVVANILTSVRRINLTLGLATDGTEIDLVRFWRNYMKGAPTIPPVAVGSGPLLDNVAGGGDVDLLKIPTPKWHEHDGGNYIGTGCMVIMQDPDTGWINYGAYRVQCHGSTVASVMTSKGKHGNLIMRRYHERGEPCPIAVVVGMHPALFMVAGIEIPYGKNEYDAAGGLIGEPVEIIAGPRTGLPLPAHAEIAFEGLVHPDDLIDEGPLGEWTGYYAGGRRPEPAIRVETFMHRNNPILVGAIPAMPPNDDTFYRGTYRCGAVWNQLEAAGVPEVRGVWSHEAGGSRFWLTVAIKQMYAGHAKQAGLIASQCHAGAYANRFVVVVDDDIDPADMNQVIWAMCTRFDAREGMEVLRGCWSTALDPMAYSHDDPRNARIVIDACRPWHRRDTFPIVARSSRELDDRIRAKWAHALPRGSK